MLGVVFHGCLKSDVPDGRDREDVWETVDENHDGNIGRLFPTPRNVDVYGEVDQDAGGDHDEHSD